MFNETLFICKIVSNVGMFERWGKQVMKVLYSNLAFYISNVFQIPLINGNFCEKIKISISKQTSIWLTI